MCINLVSLIRWGPTLDFPTEMFAAPTCKEEKKRDHHTSTKYAYGDGELRSRFGVTRRSGQAKRVHKALVTTGTLHSIY